MILLINSILTQVAQAAKEVKEMNLVDAHGEIDAVGDSTLKQNVKSGTVISISVVINAVLGPTMRKIVQKEWRITLVTMVIINKIGLLGSALSHQTGHKSNHSILRLN